MQPIKIVIEYDNETKEVLTEDVKEWLELMQTLEALAAQHGIDAKDFNWKEE